ncbi:uncharacterized protein VICG_00093 [Vittaforma corneae ATCC 50505]|uniref:Rab-GAP TBC domain-containing protein n=1 Tax=Vittaforma corneae (strain ATCC 50505) TaxID=993615 RepID=L2GPG2_VITCO|nr:uncharacterized protein VICG_00093 [Vittaforma corneae ATCC 50505]ELA42778.1 hypothetical protein VICG_00093 [Vittaforma corneae ATCC 50505]
MEIKKNAMAEKADELQRIKLKLKDLISKQLSMNDYVPINLYEIRNYIYYGFSDKSLRPSYWKVLLNYYSPNKFKLEQFYKQARQAYTDILNKTHKSNSNVRKLTSIINAELERTDFDRIQKASIGRILTAFSIINPKIGYVQGMINLVYVLYFVLSGDENIETAKFAEEDAFYLFNNLISEMSNLFIDEFDDQKQGIRYKVNEVFQIIKTKDPELYNALADKDLIKTMFPLKWILLLFSAEYPIDRTVWLWDKILSDAYRFEILLYCAAAVIILMRSIILTETYDKCLAILQKPSAINPELVFDIADTMRRDDRDINQIIKERMENK